MNLRFEFKTNVMRKTHFYLVAALVLSVFVSCKKEDSAVGGPSVKCSLSKVIYWNNSFPMTVSRDSLGNIVKYGPFDLEKRTDSLLFKNWSGETVWYILYDNLNRPIKYENSDGEFYELTYNNSMEKPERIFYKGASDSIGLTMQLTYAGENITQLKFNNNGEELNLTVDYFNRRNVIAKELKLLVPGWQLGMQIPYNFAMMFSADQVKSISLLQTSESIEYSYQYNEKGNLTKEKIMFGITDSVVTNYEYLCN